MVPLIELRGAIPIAVGMDTGLPEWAILLIAIISNMIPVNKDFDNQNIRRATLRFPLNTQVFAFWESRMQTFFYSDK